MQDEQALRGNAGSESDDSNLYQAGPASILFNDQLLRDVYREIGQVCFDRRRWKRAARYFVLCKQTDKLAECLFHLEEFDALQDLQQHLHDSSPVHKQLAAMYESVGMCELAAESYVKVRHIHRAWGHSVCDHRRGADALCLQPPGFAIVMLAPQSAGLVA